MRNDVSILQTLTDTAIDSALGYETAADRASNPALKQTLQDQARRRRETIAMLNREIVRLGGEERSSGSTAGSIHRAFTSLADAFGDSNENAAERVEEGEDYIAGKFREALDHSDLSPEARSVIQQACVEICEGERLTDRLAELHD